MLLKNNVPRLITINDKMVEGKKQKSYQIKPGNNPAVEVPDELCKTTFVKLLIKERSLLVVTAPISTDDDEDLASGEYDDMDKGELKSYAEALGLDVKSSWTKDKLIDEIVKIEA